MLLTACAVLPQPSDCCLLLPHLGDGVAFSKQIQYPPPPLSFPTPCRSPGGGGGASLGQPKFFVAAHCVVVWVTVLWGTATCIPCTHGRTFCSLSLKWNLIAQPCVPLGQV